MRERQCDYCIINITPGAYTLVRCNQLKPAWRPYINAHDKLTNGEWHFVAKRNVSYSNPHQLGHTNGPWCPGSYVTKPSAPLVLSIWNDFFLKFPRSWPQRSRLLKLYTVQIILMFPKTTHCARLNNFLRNFPIVYLNSKNLNHYLQYVPQNWSIRCFCEYMFL